MSEIKEDDTQKGVEFDIDSKEEKMEGSDYEDIDIEGDNAFSLGLAEEEEEKLEKTKGLDLDDKKAELINDNKVEEQLKEEPKVEQIPVITEVQPTNPMTSIQPEKNNLMLQEPSLIDDVTIPTTEIDNSDDISISINESDADTPDGNKEDNEIIEEPKPVVVNEEDSVIVEEPKPVVVIEEDSVIVEELNPVVVIEEIPEDQEFVEEVTIFDESVEIPTTDDQSNDAHPRSYQIKIVKVLSNNNLQEVVIELTLLYNLFFLMFVSVNSEEYASLQEQNDLSITFEEFPENLVTLFSSKPQESISIEFDNDNIMHFNERLNLRSLELFQLQFSEPDPEYFNRSIQIRFSEMKQTRNSLNAQYLSFIDEMNKKNPLMMEKMIPFMTSDVQKMIKATPPSAKKSIKRI